MFENIKSDLKFQTGSDAFFVNLKHVLISHTFHLVLLYRMGNWIHNKCPRLGIFRAIVEYIIRVIYASDISCRAKLGAGLSIMHGHDIVIGSSVVAGKKLKIFNGVTLGNKDTETLIVNQPVIGDNVVLGTGAKILGGLKIGSNSIVGANSVVIADVPENCIVAGVPSRVIRSR